MSDTQVERRWKSKNSKSIILYWFKRPEDNHVYYVSKNDPTVSKPGGIYHEEYFSSDYEETFDHLTQAKQEHRYPRRVRDRTLIYEQLAPNEPWWVIQDRCGPVKRGSSEYGSLTPGGFEPLQEWKEELFDHLPPLPEKGTDRLALLEDFYVEVKRIQNEVSGTANVGLALSRAIEKVRVG